MIIDFHVHIDEDPKASVNGKLFKMDRHSIKNSMKEANIDLSVLLNIAPKDNLNKTIEQNTNLSNICNENKEFVGLGSIHPDDQENALKEMDRCILELNLKGFKLHPNSQQFDVDHSYLDKIFKKARNLDVPIIIDSYSPFDDTQPSKLLKLAINNLETKICFAHVGYFRFLDFGIYGFMKKNSSENFENIYFDLSASCAEFYNSPFQDQFRWISEKIGPNNLLFGSDFPLYSQKEVLSIIKNFGYNKDWLPKILGENTKKLLKI